MILTQSLIFNNQQERNNVTNFWLVFKKISPKWEKKLFLKDKNFPPKSCDKKICP